MPEEQGHRKPDELSDLIPETLFDEDPSILAATYSRQQLLETSRSHARQADQMQPALDEAARLRDEAQFALDTLQAQRDFQKSRSSLYFHAAEIAHSNESNE